VLEGRVELVGAEVEAEGGGDGPEGPGAAGKALEAQLAG